MGELIELDVVEIDGPDTRFALLADGTDSWTRLLKPVPGTSEAAMMRGKTMNSVSSAPRAFSTLGLKGHSTITLRTTVPVSWST